MLQYICEVYEDKFSKHIECEHWYFKVRARNALMAHTEAVYKGIG